MKLSKNKIHKIKHKKNRTRKQIVFRKKVKTSHENSKKKGKKVINLRKKTMKRYTTGGDIAIANKDQNITEDVDEPIDNTGIELTNKSVINNQLTPENPTNISQPNNENTNSDVATNSVINNPINRMKLAHPEVIDPNPVPIEQNTDEQINAIEDTIPEASVDDETVPEATSDGTGSKSIPFTDEQLKKIYDSYKVKYIQDDSGNENETVVPFTRKSLIRLLTSTNEDGIKVRELFGFPGNMNKSQFNTGTKFNKIFANILTTVGRDENDMNMSVPVSDENDISFEEFKRFVECGTYRDQNTGDNFNCINVKPPQSTNDESIPETETNDESIPKANAESVPETNDESVPETNDESIPKANAESVQEVNAESVEEANLDTNNNVVLQINKDRQINNDLKQIDLSIFVPNNSKVIVRNYAQNTVIETLTELANYQ